MHDSECMWNDNDAVSLVMMMVGERSRVLPRWRFVGCGMMKVRGVVKVGVFTVL